MTDQTHLSAREVEEYADALKARALSTLPKDRRVHVADCLACRNEVIFLYRVNLNMKEGPDEASGTAGTLDPLQGNRHPGARVGGTPWFRMAAAIALVVGCGAFLAYLSLRHNANPPPSTQGAVIGGGRAALNPEERNKRLALLSQNAEPSANMEDLISSPYRGAALRVVAPRGGDTLQLPFTFEWERRGTGPLTLRVQTNREEERVRIVTQSNRCTLPDTLGPGLYYWTIEENGSLVSAGKFYLY